jgi:hypothetical protein
LPGAERDQIALSYDCGDSIQVEDYLELENKAVDLDTVDEHLNGGMVRGHDPVGGKTTSSSPPGLASVRCGVLLCRARCICAMAISWLKAFRAVLLVR